VFPRRPVWSSYTLAAWRRLPAVGGARAPSQKGGPDTPNQGETASVGSIVATRTCSLASGGTAVQQWRKAMDGAHGVDTADQANRGAGMDGRADFDFEVGRWHVHSRRLTAPLQGAADWEEFMGIAESRKVLGGLGIIDEITNDRPSGPTLGMTLRL